jgi:hypothetical protein
MDLLHDPTFQSSVLPLIASFLLVGVLRFSLGSKFGPEFSSAGIVIAFMIIYCVVNGVPASPPRSASQKLIYIVLASIFFGLIIDLLGRPRIIKPLVLVFLLTALIWLGWSQVIAVNWAAISSVFGLILIVVIATLNNLDNPQHQSDTPVVLLVVAIGLGVIALYSSSALIAQLSFALAAALGGFMLWNWPKEHYPFTLVGLIGTSSILFSLASILLITSKPNLIGMGFLALALFADSVLPGLPSFFQKLPRSVIVVILTLITAVPVVLAALITIIKSPPLTY